MVDPNDWRRICTEHLAVTSYDRATLDAIWEGFPLVFGNRKRFLTTSPKRFLTLLAEAPRT